MARAHIRLEVGNGQPGPAPFMGGRVRSVSEGEGARGQNVPPFPGAFNGTTYTMAMNDFRLEDGYSELELFKLFLAILKDYRFKRCRIRIIKFTASCQ